MKYAQSLAKKLLSPASFPGQGIVAAAKPYFAKQSMERVRRGTAESPVYTLSASGRQRINAPIKKGKQIAVQDDKVMGFDVHDLSKVTWPRHADGSSDYDNEITPPKFNFAEIKVNPVNSERAKENKIQEEATPITNFLYFKDFLYF